jgi:hypothetical protein
MEAFVALVAEEKLVGAVAGAALLAAHVAVVDALHHGMPSLLHYLRHRLELLRRRRRPARRLRAAERATEADEPLSRGGGRRGWSHGRSTGSVFPKWLRAESETLYTAALSRKTGKGVKMCVPCLSFSLSLSLSLSRGKTVDATWRKMIGCCNASVRSL